MDVFIGTLTHIHSLQYKLQMIESLDRVIFYDIKTLPGFKKRENLLKAKI